MLHVHVAVISTLHHSTMLMMADPSVSNVSPYNIKDINFKYTVCVIYYNTNINKKIHVNCLLGHNCY